MPYFYALSYMVISAFISYVICRLLIVASHRYGILDSVTARSSHKKPTPRIGGISFVLTNSVLLSYLIFYCLDRDILLTYWALLIPPLLVALISIIEDITSKVSRKTRLISHLAASALALALLNTTTVIDIPPLICIVFAVGITWFINLYNFMDGIDGIAATQGLFITITSSIFALSLHQNDWSTLLICLTGPLLGFLIINWQPSKIFMGDVGSTYLGALIPIILLINVIGNTMNIWCAIILTGTFLVDATWTLAFRLLSGQKWYTPHRSHSYQIFSRKLQSHAKISILNACINLFWLLPCCLLAASRPNYSQIFTLIALFPLALLAVLSKAGRLESN